MVYGQWKKSKGIIDLPHFSLFFLSISNLALSSPPLDLTSGWLENKFNCKSNQKLPNNRNYDKN